jgi:hypothetical protein
MLIVLAGAQGVYLTKWGVLGFTLTNIPLWCFGVLASIGGALFFLGPMMFGSASVRPMGQFSKKTERMLFLYLRPFELDARNILQLMVGASSGILVYISLIKGLWWPVSFVPLIISISKEQSFEDAFEPLGDFIAIGRPREKLQPIGAARVYVNKNWQQEVANYIAQARLVIIRPGESEGILWEIEQVLNTVPPERILFYLQFRGWKKRKERTYEAFRSHLQTLRSIELPNRLGKAPYLIFDTSWNPHFVREANRPAELARQIFSRSGDITRDRLRPVFKSLNIELPSQPNNLLKNVMVVFLWLSAFVAISLTFVAIALAVIALTRIFLNMH